SVDRRNPYAGMPSIGRSERVQPGLQHSGDELRLIGGEPGADPIAGDLQTSADLPGRDPASGQHVPKPLDVPRKEDGLVQRDRRCEVLEVVEHVLVAPNTAPFAVLLEKLRHLLVELGGNRSRELLLGGEERLRGGFGQGFGSHSGAFRESMSTSNASWRTVVRSMIWPGSRP